MKVGIFIFTSRPTAWQPLAAQLEARGVPLVKDLHETAWGTREIVIHDDQGHTLYLGEPL